MAYVIRLATPRELPEILQIYHHARQYMADNGNPDQWGNTHPRESLLREDISLSRLYVCTDGDQIIGVFCYFQGIDPTYLHIEPGSWYNDAPYGVIHRIASLAHRSGVASACFDFALGKCPNLRIDTHKDNIPMQRALAKNGFQYCGIIHLENGDERIAFQKTI